MATPKPPPITAARRTPSVWAGLAQGTHKVQQRVAFLEGIQLFGGIADFLENNGDSTLFSVIICNGQRNTLAFLINAEDNELSGCAFRATSGA